MGFKQEKGERLGKVSLVHERAAIAKAGVQKIGEIQPRTIRRFRRRAFRMNDIEMMVSVEKWGSVDLMGYYESVEKFMAKKKISEVVFTRSRDARNGGAISSKLTGRHDWTLNRDDVLRFCEKIGAKFRFDGMPLNMNQLSWLVGTKGIFRTAKVWEKKLPLMVELLLKYIDRFGVQSDFLYGAPLQYVIGSEDYLNKYAKRNRIPKIEDHIRILKKNMRELEKKAVKAAEQKQYVLELHLRDDISVLKSRVKYAQNISMYKADLAARKVNNGLLVFFPWLAVDDDPAGNLKASRDIKPGTITKPMMKSWEEILEGTGQRRKKVTRQYKSVMTDEEIKLLLRPKMEEMVRLFFREQTELLDLVSNGFPHIQLVQSMLNEAESPRQLMEFFKWELELWDVCQIENGNRDQLRYMRRVKASPLSVYALSWKRVK